MERIEMVMGDLADVHATPKLRKIAESVVHFPSIRSVSEQCALNILVDHVRGLIHLMADGARPGPKGRGHVVRRLFRRLLHASSLLNLDVRSAFPGIARIVLEVDRTVNPNLSQEISGILGIFDREAERMSKSTADPVI
jgi:alanyl-tRNA synthetase